MAAETPRHVAIIMDGNGRWAEERGFGRQRGHREGAKRVDEIVTACREWEIPYLTLYTFSTENWSRPAIEVNLLMRLLIQQLRIMDKKLVRNNIALTTMGTVNRLPYNVRMELNRVINGTSRYPARTTLNLALSYGGRQEIVHSFRQIGEKIRAGELAPEQIDEATIQKHLYQPNLPEPDLLIRTGGEFRISNFLLWEMAYTEFYFTPTLWPDFNRENLTLAIGEFSRRQRRYGMTQRQASQ